METYLQQSDILNATLVGLGRGSGWGREVPKRTVLLLSGSCSLLNSLKILTPCKDFDVWFPSCASLCQLSFSIPCVDRQNAPRWLQLGKYPFICLIDVFIVLAPTGH